MSKEARGGKLEVVGEDTETMPEQAQQEEVEIEVVEETEPEPSPREVEESAEEGKESEVEELKRELERIRELYLRKLAEFDNFRKRVEKERQEFGQAGAAALVRELVPVLDNLALALEHAEADPATLKQGVQMIAKQLMDVLKRSGLEVLDPKGEQFDPEKHEALQRIEDPDIEPGTVVQVLGRGYVFGGKLIRPALVAVAVGAPKKEGEESGGEGNRD